jgi:hypothetical protein
MGVPAHPQDKECVSCESRHRDEMALMTLQVVM